MSGRTRAFIVAASAIAFVSACGSSPPPLRTVTVTMFDVAFTPADVNARVGDRIEWVNKDIFDHTGTARDGAFDVPVEPGKSGSAALTRAGTIEYYCRLHPNMVGKITVTK